MDRGVWRATDHRVAKSQTRRSTAWQQHASRTSAPCWQGVCLLCLPLNTQSLEQSLGYETFRKHIKGEMCFTCWTGECICNTFCFFLSGLSYACPLFQVNQGTFHFCANPVFPHLYWGCHCEQFIFLNVPCVNFSLPGKCLLQEVTLEVTRASIPVPNCRHLLSQFHWPLLHTLTLVLHVFP